MLHPRLSLSFSLKRYTKILYLQHVYQLKLNSSFTAAYKIALEYSKNNNSFNSKIKALLKIPHVVKTPRGMEQPVMAPRGTFSPTKGGYKWECHALVIDRLLKHNGKAASCVYESSLM